MEEKEIFSSGQAVKVVEPPQSFHVALGSVQFSGPTGDSPAPVSSPVITSGSTEGKKKRGRPRKYGPDGNVALSPMPISSSIPLTGDFSAWKRGRGKPVESIKKSFKFYEVEGQGAGQGKKDCSLILTFLEFNLIIVTALFLCFTVALAVYSYFPLSYLAGLLFTM